MFRIWIGLHVYRLMVAAPSLGWASSAAVVHGGATYRAGAAVGTPLGALTPDSGPREVAAAIIHEAHRRGYSPYQTTAILADALEESNLSPRAVSPNRLWVSIFQQDASYPPSSRTALTEESCSSAEL